MVVSLEELVRQRLANAFRLVAGEQFDPALRRSQHADFQSDGALALAKRLRKNPRDLASKVIAKAALEELCHRVEISGPGFINLTISNATLGRMITALCRDDRPGSSVTVVTGSRPV